MHEFSTLDADEAKQTHLRPLVSWNYGDKNLSSSSSSNSVSNFQSPYATSYIIIYEVVNKSWKDKKSK